MVCSHVRGAVVDTTACAGIDRQVCIAAGHAKLFPPPVAKAVGHPREGRRRQLGPRVPRLSLWSRPRHVKVACILYLHGSPSHRITSAIAPRKLGRAESGGLVITPALPCPAKCPSWVSGSRQVGHPPVISLCQCQGRKWPRISRWISPRTSRVCDVVGPRAREKENVFGAS